MAISMLKIRRPLGRLIFNMGIAIPGKTVFLIETPPWFRRIIHCLVNLRFWDTTSTSIGNDDFSHKNLCAATPAWISDHTHYKVCDEIMCPLNSSGVAVMFKNG